MPTESVMLFYKGSKLSTVLTGHTHCTLMSANNQNLCENSQAAKPLLLATDAQDSTVATGSDDRKNISYSPYGKDSCLPESSLLSRYTGQRWLTSGIGYLLGNGHRLYNPVLMRFYSSDTFSPFEEGDINAYAYCGNAPINRVDPSGRMFGSFIKRMSGGYSYSKLKSRLKNENPNFSINEYNAFEKSLAKRERRNEAVFNRTLQYNLGNADHWVDISDRLKSQRRTLQNLHLDKNNRYNPKRTENPETHSHRRGSSDSAISESWSQLGKRFQKLLRENLSPRPQTHAQFNSLTWPRAHTPSQDMLDFTGNYIDKTVNSLRTTSI